MGIVGGGKWWGLRCGAALAMVVLLSVVYTVTMKSGQRYKWSGGLSKNERMIMNSTPMHEPTEISPKAYTSTSSGKQASNVVSYWSEEKKVDLATVPAERSSGAQTTKQLKSLPNTTQISSPMLASQTIPPLGNEFVPLRKEDITDVKTFVVFVGFARSGHSIVGALMDAHPDMVIAYEYNVLKYMKKLTSNNDPLLLFNKLYNNTYISATRSWYSEKEARKGYTLSVSQNSWQGRVRRLRVIGDKSGSMTVLQHKMDPTKCQYLVDKMQGNLGISVKAIRVLRNPYDNIATVLLYNTMKIGEIPRNSSEIANFRKPAIATKHISDYFELASGANRIITDCHLPVLYVHLSDLISQPISVMRDMCDFVGVECSVDYLDACAGKLFPSLSKTRNLVKWSQEQIDNVAQNIRSFSEFSRYYYDSDC